MNPITIHPMVYALKLEGDRYYIGISLNAHMRIATHFAGRGSRWTRLHKPVEVCEVIYPAKKEDEDELTLAYMRHFGWEKCRGGKYSSVHLTKPFEL